MPCVRRLGAPLGAASLLSLGGCFLSHPLDGEPAPAVALPEDVPATPPVRPVSVPAPADPEDVRDACETGERLEVSTLVVLPGNTARPCPWGQGDNLDPAQERATARIEDTSAPVAPEGVVVCSLDLDFAVETAFRYDDNFALLFGDSVLAASDRSLVERLPRRGAVHAWQWSAVAGARMLVAGSNPYCVGADEGRADCTLPDSDLSDRLALAFDAALIDELSFRAFEAGRADFTVIAIGDNDPPTDCRYTPLTVRVTTTYVRTDPA